MSLPAGACLALRLHSRLEIDTSLRGLDLFGEVGRAFNAPTLDQLYDPRPLPGPEGDFALSNPALVPQRSRGWEVGLRGRTPAFEGRLVAYRLIVGNEIDFDPASFRYANIGRSRHQGVEASGRLEAGRFGVLYAAYARSEAEAEGAFPSAQLKNFPRDVLRLAWSGGLGGGVELGLQQSFLRDETDRAPPLIPVAWRSAACSGRCIVPSSAIGDPVVSTLFAAPRSRSYCAYRREINRVDWAPFQKGRTLMKMKTFTTMALVSTILIGGGAAFAGDSQSDWTTTLNVKLALLNKLGTDSLKIDVDSTAGALVLKGTVAKRETKELAETVAESVAGVKSVENDILLAANVDNPNKAGVAAGEAEAELKDALLETKIRLALVDKMGSEGFKVGTEAASGVVTLRFDRDCTSARRAEATKVVKGVDGVTKVLSVDKT